MPSPSASRPENVRKARRASTWRPARYSASMRRPCEPFVKGISDDQCLELADEVGMATEREVGVDAESERSELEAR